MPTTADVTPASRAPIDSPRARTVVVASAVHQPTRRAGRESRTRPERSSDPAPGRTTPSAQAGEPGRRRDEGEVADEDEGREGEHAGRPALGGVQRAERRVVIERSCDER